MPYKNKEIEADYRKRRYLRLKNCPEEKKRLVIKDWKRRGIKDEDLNLVYDYFITQTHCWICDVKYDKKNLRCLDHCHETGDIRYIICYKCNFNKLRNYKKKNIL